MRKGSSYNAYLVWDKKRTDRYGFEAFAGEFIDGLKKEIDLRDIDYIVANHAEIDHSGALPALLRQIPDTPVYCTANAWLNLSKGIIIRLKFYHGQNAIRWISVIKQAEHLWRPMLHWPDSMFVYLTGYEHTVFQRCVRPTLCRN